MRKSPIALYGVPLVMVATLLLMPATPSAQRRGRADPSAAGVPVATNTITRNPDAYYGKTVTISAGIEQVLSKTAFVVDQRKAVSASEARGVGAPLLVIAPELSSELDPKHYLLVRGQIVKLDAAALAKAAPSYTLDLAPDVRAKYEGQPVLVAVSVLNSTSVEIGKKPVPPPTAEEASMSAAMKTISQLFGDLRGAAQGSTTDVVVRNAAQLQPAFAQAETIWTGLGQTRPAGLSRDARTLAASIEQAAAAGKWDEVNAAFGHLNQQCQSCHGTYRAQMEDGSYRFKPGPS